MKSTIQAALRVGFAFGTLLLGLGTDSAFQYPSSGQASAADPKSKEPAAPAALVGGRQEPQDVPSSNSTKSWDFRSRSPIARKIESELQNPTEVNFTDVPLKDALEYLEELHHIEIWTDAKALSDEGISLDTTVTLTMSGASLRTILRLLLNPMSLDYVIKNDVLMVTTETVTNEMYDVRVYNTSRLPNIAPKDLVEIITSVVEPGNWSVKKVPETPTTKIFAPNAPILNRTSTGESTEAPAPNPAEAEPHKPAEGGGAFFSPTGSICAVSNTLVIRQTRRIHDEIVDLLEQLERQQATVQSKSTRP